MQNHAFADLFKQDWMKAEWMKPTADFNQIFTSQRRNMEAITEANQVMIEGMQAISRAGGETIRTNMETVLKNSKSVFTGGSPESSLARQAELTHSLFEMTLSNMREMTEVATKCSFEAFDVLNRRATESVQETSKQHYTNKKK